MKSKFRLFLVLLVCFGSLVVVSAGAIITINFVTSAKVFSQMLAQVVLRSADGLEVALRKHLDAAEYQADFIIENIRSGSLSLERPDQLAEFAAGSFAAAPQISGLAIADAQGHFLRIRRDELGSVESQWQGMQSDPLLVQLGEEIRTRRNPYWGQPVFSDFLNATLMNYRAPLWNGDEYQGYVAVGISTQELSDLASKLSDPPNSNVFVLYGKDRILAHSYLVLQSGNVSARKPILSISEFTDPVIQQLGSVTPAPEIISKDGINFGQLKVGDIYYGVMTRQISGYGSTPIFIGAYFDGSGVSALMRSILRASLIGGIILFIGFGVVLWLSGVVTRPIRRTSEVASTIAALEFEGINPLPHNRIREMDDLATSFNAMLIGLKSFGRYVPRNLVRKLIRENRDGAGIEERELTVMFTDIVGFTSACEGMSPSDVAEFINHHLALVSRCIEREGGTIDKYIGDAVMAFWGAPDSIDNPTLRALRAAAALRTALAEDNKIRTHQNLPKVRIRIGIHTGRLIVGDIGSPERINYTVIGDVVNTTQRLEALGKEVDPEAEAIVLFSRSVKDNIGSGLKYEEIGKMKVKGRQGEVEVFRLAEGQDAV